MIRIGERGEGKFKKVSWDEALDYLADRLSQYLDAPEQIALFAHQGAEKGILSSFIKMLGSPNITGHADTCYTSSSGGRWFVFGKHITPGAVYPDYENARFIVFMGRNPYGGFVSSPWAAALSMGYRNGSRIVVFDVRFSDICEIAEKYYIVKPGTDLAISLAIANYIISNQLYNEEYLRQYTNSSMLLYTDDMTPVATTTIEDGSRSGKLDYLVYDEDTGDYKYKLNASKPALMYKGTYEGREIASALQIISEAIADYTPEWAASITGVEADEIVWVAEELVKWAPRSFIDHGYKSVRYYNEPMFHRVNAMINALLGSIGVKGGWAWPRKLKPSLPFKFKPKDVESVSKYWTNNGYPLLFSKHYSMLMVKSILEEKPYPIKAAIIYLENLVSHMPNDDIAIKALKKLDLVVVIDVMWSETCNYADIILPIPFFFEHDNASLFPVKKSHIGQICVMKKAVDPPEGIDVKPTSWIVYELVKRMKPEHLGDIEIVLRPTDIWMKQCEKLGIDYDKLMRYGTLTKYEEPAYNPLTSKGALPTKTGEIEMISIAGLEKFKDYLGKENNLNPIITWVKPKWMDGGLADDEFVPVDYMNRLVAINTWARNTRLLLEMLKWEEGDYVIIHTERAKKLGIKDGDIVEVYNPQDGRSLKVKIKTTHLISPELIAGVHGLTPGRHMNGDVKFTYMPKHGLNTNYLAPFTIIEGIGSAALFDYKVKIRR
jgi:thiosulfate reductase/polysulfide reductase chain A